WHDHRLITLYLAPALDQRTQAGHRIGQCIALEFADALPGFLDFLRRRFLAPRRAVPAERDRTLPDCKPADAAPAEIAVHALDDDRLQMLDFECIGAFDPDLQHADRIRIVAARPDQLDRFRSPGEVLADDLLPM